MKIDILKLPYTKVFEQEEDLTFDPEIYRCYLPLVSIELCHAKVKAQRFEEFIYVTVSVNAKVTLQCSYTLVNFKTTLKGEDELHFAPSNDEDDDCIVFKGNSIELDKYIFDLISALVPPSPKAPGAKPPKSGDGYRVFSEDEYLKEKSENKNSPFDSLKDIDFDE